MLINEIKHDSLDSGLEFAEIVSDFEMLLHVEYPILYVGKNIYGSRIIGSFLEEDEDDLTILHYVHFIIKNIDYSDFKAGRISYRDIFEVAKTAFLLKKDLASAETQSISLINADTIPTDYYPHKKSFYPKKKKASSLSYKISLEGGIADEYHALSKDLLEIQSACSDILFETINKLPDLDLEVSIYQSAHTEGSVQMNFEVNIVPNKNDLFFHDSPFAAYQNYIIEYIIKNLSVEAVELYSTESTPPLFQSLVDKAKKVYTDLGIGVDNENLQQIIKECVHHTASNIVKASSSIGISYDSLSFTSVTSESVTELIAEVTDSSKAELMQTVSIIDNLLIENDDSITDEEPKDYKVYIYNLNTKTRNGTGIIVAENGDVSEPRISIIGSEPLEETKFTESIYTRRVIDVRAIGTTKNGRVKRLIIEF